MSQGEPRAALPTVVVGYGEEGRNWLSDLRGSLIADGPLRELIEASVVQFWAWGLDEQAAEADVVESFSVAAPAVGVREVLDRGRSKDLRERIGLDLKTVLVLERWSPVRTDAEARTSFVAAMDLASRANCEAGEPNLFDYQWIGLVDATRGPGALSVDAHASARRHRQATSFLCANLFVDREDCELGTLTLAHADRALGAIAGSLVQANVARDRLLPRLTEELSQQTSNPHELLVPVSVTSFRHGVAERRDLAVGILGSRLDLVECPYMERPEPSISEVYEAHLEEVRTGHVSLNSVNHRAQKAATSLLAWFIATVRRESETGATELGDLKRVIRSRPQASVSVNGPGTRVAPLSWWRRLLHWLLPFLFRSSPPAAVEPVLGLPTPDAAEALAEVNTEWERVVEALESAMQQWHTYMRGAGRKRARPGNAMWVFEGGNCILVGSQQLDSQPIPPTEKEVERLAFHSLSEAPSDSSRVSMAIEKAATEAVHAEAGEQGWTLVSEAFRGTSRQLYSTLVAPLKVNTGVPLEETRVFWFCDERCLPAGVVEALDPQTSLRGVTTVETSNPGITLRLAIGEPIPWDDVISLKAPVGGAQ